jgi:hypothetical protein
MAGNSHAAMFGVVMTVYAMLIAPFHSWHMRRGAIATETLLPATRKQYIRQVALAVGWDVFAWTALASVFSLAVMSMMVREKNFSPLDAYGLYLLFLWSGAVFAYGLGLATMRSRYWLPLMVGLSLAWMVTILVAGERITPWLPRGQDLREAILIYGCVLSWLLTGTLLTIFTLFRWRRADVP